MKKSKRPSKYIPSTVHINLTRAQCDKLRQAAKRKKLSVSGLGLQLLGKAIAKLKVAA